MARSPEPVPDWTGMTSAVWIQGRKIRILAKRVKLSLADRTRARLEAVLALNSPGSHLRSVPAAPMNVAPTINRRNATVKSNPCYPFFQSGLLYGETFDADEAKSSGVSRTGRQPPAACKVRAACAV
jgi:hypothetical protein